MIESEVIALITNVGFPIAVCLYFMFKTEKVINNNTEMLATVTEIIRKCQK